VRPRRAVAFDFDGVLVDTSNEILVTAHAAVTGKRSCLLSDVPVSAAEFFHRWHEQALNAANMVSLLSLWHDGFQEEVSRELLKAVSIGREQELVSALFSARAELIALDEKSWASLTQPYEPLWGALCSGYWGAPIIVTNKDRASVKVLCDFHGLDLAEATVLSGDPEPTGVVVNKQQRLKSLLERYAEVLFIEDSFPHLLDALALPGISGALVGWGPVSIDDKQRAESLGVPSLDLKDSRRFISDWLAA
jgi:FMN phosphatase YigB (HAD superfamily)